MKFYLFSVILIITSASLCTNAHIVHNTGNDDFRLVTHLVNPTTIEFQLNVNTRGWVGVGVGPFSNMTDADLAVVTGNKEDGTTIWDMYSTRNTRPVQDSKAESDWKIVDVDDIESRKIFHIQRALKTEDPNEGDDVEITEEPLFIIWGFGESDNFTIHSKRGSIPNKVNLLTPEGGPNGAFHIKAPVAFVVIILGSLMLLQ